MFVPHKPWYFSEYADHFDSDGNIIGFKINTQIYFFDQYGGWADQQGCYYNKNCEPDGWLIPDGKDTILFFDQEKKFKKSYKLADLKWLENQEHFRKRNQQAAKQMQIIAELGWNLMKIEI